MTKLEEEAPVGTADDAPDLDEEQQVRKQAIAQIEKTRRFWSQTFFWGLGMVLLTVIWAITEFHNAGGWPTDGFSESSGIAHVWNYWIIYPAVAFVLLTGARAWSVFGNKPISEDEIRREMDRQTGTKS